MKSVGVILVVACMVFSASNVFCHDAGGCTHTHGTLGEYEGSWCTGPPGEECTAECGGEGYCQNVAESFYKTIRCVCLQKNQTDSYFVNSVGWHTVDVVPPDIILGGTNTFIFQETSSEDAMVFVYGNVPPTRIDSLLGGFTGQLVIDFNGGDPLHIYGEVVSFYVMFPSYDFFGEPTGTNFWELDPAGPRGVTYHINEGYIQTDEPLTLSVANDIVPPDEPGWVSLYIMPGRSARLELTESNEVPAPTPAWDKCWGTVKALLR